MRCVPSLGTAHLTSERCVPSLGKAQLPSVGCGHSLGTAQLSSVKCVLSLNQPAQISHLSFTVLLANKDLVCHSVTFI